MDHEGQEGQEEDGMNDGIDETMIVVCPLAPLMICLPHLEKSVV